MENLTYKSEERKGIERGLGKNTEWMEQDLAAKADTPLIDSGRGKKVVIRKFDFNWNKGISVADKMNAQYNKQEFFNKHAALIKSTLWKDGLIALENQDPKIIFNNNGYAIAIACEARFGLNIFEKGSTLQDILKKK